MVAGLLVVGVLGLGYFCPWVGALPREEEIVGVDRLEGLLVLLVD